MRMNRPALLSLLLLGVASCSTSRELPATLLLSLTYDESLALTALEIAIQTADRTADVVNLQAPIQPELPVTIDKWDGGEVVVDVWGLKGETRLVHGTLAAAPIRGMELAAAVVLTELLCQDACTLGETRCDGNAVIACVRATEGCTVWGSPRSCPTDAPVCAAGSCGDGCLSGCPAKDPVCLSGTQLRSYGAGVCEGSSCNYPVTDTDCAPGICADARCQGGCQDECDAGATDCQGAATVDCGDEDGDGCRRWRAPVPCPAREPECVSATALRTYDAPTCAAGACAYAWTDTDCAPGTCAAGACLAGPTCQDNETDCSGACVDTRDGDGANCGGCGRDCLDDPTFCLGGNCEDPGEISCQAGECCRALGAQCNPYFQMCCGDQNAIGCVNWICQYW